MNNRFAFVGGSAGRWRVAGMDAIKGEGMAAAASVDLLPWEQVEARRAGASWVLAGQISNLRYTMRGELAQLRAVQEPLGRPHATRAALIPITKSSTWWSLAQDERREIFEETSQHNSIGMKFLPAIARQLFHCRDLAEPFDFLTFFEFAAEHEAAFDDLVGQLRASREWTYVEREIDIRLDRV